MENKRSSILNLKEKFESLATLNRQASLENKKNDLGKQQTSFEKCEDSEETSHNENKTQRLFIKNSNSTRNKLFLRSSSTTPRNKPKAGNRPLISPKPTNLDKNKSKSMHLLSKPDFKAKNLELQNRKKPVVPVKSPKVENQKLKLRMQRSKSFTSLFVDRIEDEAISRVEVISKMEIQKPEVSVEIKIIDQNDGLRDERNMFRKRKGTTNFGTQFEDLTISHLVFEMIKDNKIEDFLLSSNEKNYDVLDDVVFDVKYSSGLEEKYAMQLKYTNDSKKKLQRQSFSGNEGEFSLYKYFKGYNSLTHLESLKCIICTNRTFDQTALNESDKGDEVTVKFGSDVLTLRILECRPELEILFFRNVSGKTCHCYKFEIISNSLESTGLSKYQNYFNNLLLLTDVMTVEEFEENLRQNFFQNVSSNKEMVRDYMEYIKKWSLKEGNKIKLRKSFMREVIGLLLLTPHLKNISLCQSVAEPVNDKAKLILEAILKFKISVFNKQCLEKIQTLLQEFSNTSLDFQIIQKNFFHYDIIRSEVQNVDQLNNIELTKILWLMGECPLVVDDSHDVRKAIHFCQNQNLRFILLCENFESSDLSSFDIFQSLTDLEEKASDIYENIFEKFCFVLQEKNIFLKDLAEFTESGDLSKIVTTNELLDMLGGSLRLQKMDEELPPSYIKRSLSRPIINVEFLKSDEQKSSVFISSFSEDDPIMEELNNLKIEDSKTLTIRHKLILETRREFCKMKKKIYVTNSKDSREIFERLCSLFSDNKNFHELRLVENSRLEWIRSRNGGIDELTKYLVEGFYVNEDELFRCETDNKVNIICDEPGMGKTSLMKSMKKKSSSEILWTILIFVKNHFAHFQQNRTSDVDQFKRHILESEGKTLTPFGMKLLKMFMKEGRIRYIWDGLDELSNDNFQTVRNIVDALSKEDCKQWLTSRNNLREDLENHFKVIAKTIREFGKEDQNIYFQNRLDDVLIDSRQKILKHNFWETPLQIFLLTELLRQDSTKYSHLFNESLTVPDLYKYFVDAKIDMYNKEHLNLDENTMLHRKISAEKEELISNYEKVAALSYFLHVVPKDLGHEVKQFLDQTQKYHDCYGFITKVTEDNRVEFFHTSFGEYFAVSYLVKIFDDIPRKSALVFEDENIQYIFDVIVSEQCKAHRAVLQNSFALLKSCTDAELRQKDKVGRSALLLVCCHSKKHSILRTEKEDDVYIIDDRAIHWQNLKPQTGQEDILNYLMDRCEATEVDKFGYDCFMYAYRNNCFPLIALMESKHHRNLELSETRIATVLYYSVRFNYAGVFDKIERIPFIKSMHFDKSLLFLAVYYNSVNSLEKILSNTCDERYREIIEQGSEPLFKQAYESNFDKIMMILLSNGVKLEKEQAFLKQKAQELQGPKLKKAQTLVF